MRTPAFFCLFILLWSCDPAFALHGPIGHEPAQAAPQAKEHIYVFLYKVYPDQVNPYLGIKRARSFEEAQTLQNDTSRPQWAVTKRLDEDRCRKGFYILGINNGKGEGTMIAGKQVVAGFLNCGYATVDEAIDKGTHDFPMPFFNIAIGAVSAKDGPETQLVCRYSVEKRQWSDGASFGEVGWSNPTDGCDRLNGRYPILVDREPEQTMWVSPR